jgi:citrate lyase synthetase
MTTITSNTSKSNNFTLSTQVQNILHQKGFSHLFNYSDFQYFKKQAKDEFNKAEAIAQLFIEENRTEISNFQEYVF